MRVKNYFVKGHYVQFIVKFLAFKKPDGSKFKRVQYTAIDDATCIRVLKIYEEHTQLNAIHFLDYVIEKFPFRIQTVWTDSGKEFHSLFHWHVVDSGIQHDYIQPGNSSLKCKAEPPHKTSQQEIFQLLEYSGDAALEEKLEIWENFYNSPNCAWQEIPYEFL